MTVSWKFLEEDFKSGIFCASGHPHVHFAQWVKKSILTKMLITLSFFTDLDKNIHQSPSSDGESKYVPSLTIFFAQWVRNLIFLDFFDKNAHNFVIFLPIWMKIHMKAHLQMENQNFYQFWKFFAQWIKKLIFLDLLWQKRPSLCHFLTDFDENTNGDPFSDDDLKSVPF